MAGFSKTKKQIAILPDEKKERAKALLKKVEFMDRELEKLQAVILKKGWSEEYQNGANQSGVKKCTEGDVYNTLIKNYATVMRSLNDMLPEGDDRDEDALDKFNKII